MRVLKKAWVLNSLVLLCIVFLLAGCGKSKKPKISVPDAIVITPQYTASLPWEPIFNERIYQPPVEQLDQVYAYARYLSAADLEGLYDCDPDIVVTRTAEGIKFTSQVKGDYPGEKNRFVRLAYKDKTGLIELATPGEIGIDVYADIDLSNTTNGLHARLYREGKEVQKLFARVRGDNPVHLKVLSDLIFHTTIDGTKDQVYIGLTIPWQGSITVKGVYLYYMSTGVTGFTDMAERITGGTGAAPENIHIVTNAQEFHQALTSVKANAKGAPSVIYVDGQITLDEYKAASGSDQIKIDVRNLSIIGVGTENGTNGEFDGVGFKISSENIIIRNIKIHHVLDGDGIEINNAKYVMVDHCTFFNDPIIDNAPDELKDKYDELISLKNQTECVILSWNELYDSYKTILVGSNDQADALPDRKLIMHHNYIHDCNSRLPLYRGGHAHIYNNYYLNNNDVINCRTGSKLLIEHNYFENCKKCIGFWNDNKNPSGQWQVRDNRFINCDYDTPEYSTCEIDFGSDYIYHLDDVNNVPGIVTEDAGARLHIEPPIK